MNSNIFKKFLGFGRSIFSFCKISSVIFFYGAHQSQFFNILFENSKRLEFIPHSKNLQSIQV